MDTSHQMTREQAEEARLEIGNRIRNLFWTISGDYKRDIKPDIYAFARSKYIALYDAVKQGAFAKYYDADSLALYMMKKIHYSAQQAPLLELTQICIDAAVFPALCRERSGTAELRRKAFRDLLDTAPKDSRYTVFGMARIALMYRFLGRELPASFPSEILKIAGEISALEDAPDTDTIIQTMDRLYNTYFDQRFEEEHGTLSEILKLEPFDLVRSAYEDFLTDEQMEKILQKILKQQGREMYRLEVDGSSLRKFGPPQYLPLQVSKDGRMPDEKAMARVRDYVVINYGESFLDGLQQRQMNDLVCRGIHRGCSLHCTEGILHAKKVSNYQFRFGQMQLEKNRFYYYNIHRVVKRNIAILAEILKKSLALRDEITYSRARSGILVPSRLWMQNRSEDDRFFNKKNKCPDADFVVDILLDSSSSQMKRQSQVAVQGYIISSALSSAGIPHRVTGFSTFWDYTVLQRFRDYDDPEKKDERLFEFRSSGSNRDGLAVKAIYTSLRQRPEDHKIMIVLSDGRPNDQPKQYAGAPGVAPYVGEAAVNDTASEVRRARALDICCLGVFSGSPEDLAAEKKIFGKDFAYIRNLGNFSHIVGTYLRKQIEEE